MPWQRPFLEALTRGVGVMQACRSAGISRERVRQVREDDPVFAQFYVEARDIGLDMAEAILFRRASTGEPRTTTKIKTVRDPAGVVLETVTEQTTTTHVSDNLLLAHLRANRPNKWGDRVQHRGDPDAPIVHEHGPVRRTPERLAALLELAAADKGMVIKVAEGEVVMRPPGENGSAALPPGE